MTCLLTFNLSIFTLSNLSLPSLLMRVSDPSFVQLWDDAFLYMIKPAEPLKSAACLITRKKYELMHENINDACKLYIDHKLLQDNISLHIMQFVYNHFSFVSFFHYKLLLIYYNPRIETQSKLSPLLTFSVDNQVIFSFFVGKNAILSNNDQGGWGIHDTTQMFQLLLARIAVLITEFCSVHFSIVFHVMLNFKLATVMKHCCTYQDYSSCTCTMYLPKLNNTMNESS